MRRPCLVELSLLLASTQALHPQLNRGVLEGIVTDQQGALIPGVDATINNAETNVSNTTKTNNTGYYRVEDLVLGKSPRTLSSAALRPWTHEY